MPESGPLCLKCRVGFSRSGDTWCQLCSCAQSLNTLARSRFHFSTHRSLAEEVAYQAVRTVQALVDVDKGHFSQVTSLSDRLKNAQAKLDEHDTVAKTAVAKSSPAGPASLHRAPSPLVKREAPDHSPGGESQDYTEGEEEEGPEVDPACEGDRGRGPSPRTSGGHLRPPLPAGSPPRRESRREPSDRSRSRGRPKHRR